MEEFEGPPGSCRMKSIASEKPRPTTSACAVESLIELFSERWAKVGSQADADRLQVEIEEAAKTLAPEQLLAYAAAPHLRARLLALCVFARAQERAAVPRGCGTRRDDQACAEPPGDPGLLTSSGERDA